MLAGHYAPAYLLHGRDPRVPLLAFFIAVQAPDIVFFILVPLGIEHVALDQAVRGPLGMELLRIPYTHALSLTLLYAAAIALAGTLWRHWRVGVALAVAVLSHWALDLVVHEPDLPLTVAGATRVGFGLWRYALLAYLLEVGLVVGSAIWLAGRLPSPRARRWLYTGAAVLTVVQTIYVILPPPDTDVALAIQAELTYLVAAVLAWAVDRQLAG
jgi:hypothetical protein